MMEPLVGCKASKQLMANKQQPGLSSKPANSCDTSEPDGGAGDQLEASSDGHKHAGPAAVVYDVEHLATFSTNHPDRLARSGRKQHNGHPTRASSNSGDSSSSELDVNYDDDYDGGGDNDGGTDSNCAHRQQATGACDCKISGHDNDHGEREQKLAPARRARPGKGPRPATNAHNRLKNHANGEQNVTKPRVALEKLFQLEKLSGIWTQRMQIELRHKQMLIVDCETSSVVERFSRDCVRNPQAFNEYNDIYNNIVVFKIEQHPAQVRARDTSKQEPQPARSDQEAADETRPDHPSAIGDELHIFQCVHHQAQQLVDDICAWKAGHLFAGQQLADGHPSGSASDQPSAGRPEAAKSAARAANQGLVGEPKHGGECDESDAPTVRAQAAPGDERIMTKNEDEASGQPDRSQRLGPAVSAKQVGQSKSAASDKINQQQQNGAANKVTSADPQTQATNNQQHPADQAGGQSKPIVTVASSSASLAEHNNNKLPMVNVNVKETVQVFNQIAALREKGSKPNSPTGPSSSSRPLSDSSMASSTNAPNQTGLGGLGSSSGHQLYKQRSIRVTLAPNSDQKQAKATNEKSSSASSQANNKKPQDANTSEQRPPVASSGPSSGSGSASLSSSSSSAHHHQSGPASKPKSAGGQSHQQSAPSSRHHAGNSGKNSRPTPGAANNGPKPASSLAPSGQQAASSSSGSLSSTSARTQSGSPPTQSNQHHHQLDQVTTNESYVSVLNHCFDDIEKFIIRLQQAASALRELQAKRKLSKRSSQLALNSNAGGPLNGLKTSNGHNNPPLADTSPQPALITASELSMLSSRARGPNEDDYFEILSKFKLAFNLLAKLKGCIHEPNAPELVHFLFTPLAIIIESARNVMPPIDPTLVGIPYLNRDALDLLSNCCTSKESDMWHSLGPNWTQTIEPSLLKASRLPSSFQPIFSDGWAPIITELELIGLGLGGADLGGGGGATPKAKTAGAPKAAVADIPPGGDHYRDRRSYVAPDDLLPQQQQQMQLLGEAPEFGADGANHAPYRGRHAARRNHRPGSPPGTAKGLSYPPPLGPLANGARSRSYGYGLDGAPLPSTPGEMVQHQLGPAGRAKSGSRHRPVQQVTDLVDCYPLSPPPAIHYQQHAGYQDELADDYHAPPMQPGAHLAGGDYYTELHYQDQYPQFSRSRLTGGAGGYPNGADARQLRNQRAANGQLHHYNSGLNMMADLGPAYGHDAGLNFSEADREAMLLDLGPAQTDWFLDLQARGALTVRVLFSREANNDKELTVRRGEILEILDDTRKWWKARNIDLQVAYVPHTIVAIIEQYQTLDELLTNSPIGTTGAGAADLAANDSHGPPENFHHRPPPATNRLIKSDFDQINGRKDKRNSKTAGAFRYF